MILASHYLLYRRVQMKKAAALHSFTRTLMTALAYIVVSTSSEGGYGLESCIISVSSSRLHGACGSLAVIFNLNEA